MLAVLAWADKAAGPVQARRHASKAWPAQPRQIMMDPAGMDGLGGLTGVAGHTDAGRKNTIFNPLQKPAEKMHQTPLQSAFWTIPKGGALGGVQSKPSQRMLTLVRISGIAWVLGVVCPPSSCRCLGALSQVYLVGGKAVVASREVTWARALHLASLLAQASPS